MTNKLIHSYNTKADSQYFVSLSLFKIFLGKTVLLYIIDCMCVT